MPTQLKYVDPNRRRGLFTRAYAAIGTMRPGRFISRPPKGLRRSLSGHEVRTAPEMGWGDLDNGDLLDATNGIFGALVTVDKRLPQQQHITDRPLGVVVLRAKSNRLTWRRQLNASG